MINEMETIVLFTRKPIEETLERGGSDAWALGKARAENCTYCVLTRNAHHENTGPERHGSGFMVGKILDIIPAPERPERWIVRFSEYAEINIPNMWGGWRNPVIYQPESEIEIDFENLDWHAMPEPTFNPGRKMSETLNLDPAALKDLLREATAQTMGVDVEKVRVAITIDD